MPLVHKQSLASMLAETVLLTILCAAYASAQSTSGTINGTVLDPSGAVVTKATLNIHNPVSGYSRTTTTDAKGNFSFTNVPFNPYHMTVTATGFAQQAQDVEVRSIVPVAVTITLGVSTTAETVNVEAGGDLIENDPTFHTDVDRDLFDKIPLESTTSELSSEVTLATPGIAADSNGLFHGLGDHAENSFSVDGQPITDQQSKVFSNQLPLDAVQSMEVVSGAPPAEFGGKTSVVIVATTRSGLGVTTPHGSVTGSYGTFGTSNLAAELAYGGKNWGNFIAANGQNTGRFLDPPEFSVMHDKGNEENVFDRVDYQFNGKDSIRLDFQYTRSWFQTPNTFDNQNATPWSGLYGILPTIENYGGVAPDGVVVGPTDQRSKIQTFNIAPSWTRVLNTHMVSTLGGWVRRDAYNYYPSDDPFADLGPPSLQRQTVGQERSLTNAGMRATLSYVKGINNVKGGASYEQTFLDENDTVGIVDPTYNSPCVTLDTVTTDRAFGTYVAVPGFTDPSQCVGTNQPNTAANPNAPNSTLYPYFNPTLAPYDLTRGGSLYVVKTQDPTLTHTDVKEAAFYIEDSISKGPWNFNLGLRGDTYNGLTSHGQAEPRLGAAYNIKATNTVLRLSYAHTMESPFNENLILSSLGCANPVLAPLLICSAPLAGRANPLSPGLRNEYHAGFEQAFGKYLVASAEYIWKYTHLGYDFSVLGDTPITFPIEWTKSKIPGYAGRLSMPNYRGFSALVVFSSVAARFFPPQLGGAGATVGAPGLPFRIDHDEKWAQTAHFQYQFPKRGPWIGFNWRYDSGLVAGNTPCYGTSVQLANDCPQSTTLPNGQPGILMNDYPGNPLTGDLESEAGFSCNGVKATPTSPLPSVCPANEFTSNLVNIPPPGEENDDHHPPRIQHRSLLDLAIGDDNVFRFDHDRYKVSLQLTAINLTNKYALYNFLSTFSGTHYVTPRALTGEIGFHF